MPLSYKPDRAVRDPIRGYAPKTRRGTKPPTLDVMVHSFSTRHP
jgi:hypothetical protein